MNQSETTNFHYCMWTKTHWCSLGLPGQCHNWPVCRWIIEQIFNKRTDIAGRLQRKCLYLVLQQKFISRVQFQHW